MSGELGILGAFAALLVSAISAVAAWSAVRHSKRQADLAALAVLQSRESAQTETVMKFIDRFLDLVRDGLHFDDARWALQYWRLLATEYYFLVNGILPAFMFNVWMEELADFYVGDPNAWRSHHDYLVRNELRSPKMMAFFVGLKAIIDSHESGEGRIREIDAYVMKELNKHPNRALR